MAFSFRSSAYWKHTLEQAANSDWRWGIVATDAAIIEPRYSALQHGRDGQPTFCINAGEALWLVVMATPSVQR